MQVLFLGTGPAVGIPRKKHTDPACKDARHGGKSRRQRSAAIVSQGKSRILIDAGPDIEAQLKTSKPNSLDALLITHGHRDAVDGLKEINRWAKKQLPHALPVLTDKKTMGQLLNRYGPLSCLQFVPFEAFEEFIVKEFQIVPVPVEHSKDIPTWGYVLNRHLFYASDFGDLPSQTAKRIQGIPNMILDGTFWFDRKVLLTHLTLDEAIEWSIKLEAKRLILTQIGHTYPPHTEAEKKLKQYLKLHEIKKPSVELGFDGMRVRF